MSPSFNGLYFSSAEYTLEPCEDPGMPRFGRRNGYSFGIGDTLTFSCNLGYRLEGAPELICLGGGRRMWSAPLPRCVGKVHLCACLRGKVGTINIAFYQMNEFRWIVTMFAGFPALNTVYVKPCMRFGWNTSSGAAVKILKGSTYAQKHTHVANNPNWLWKDVLKGNTVYRCDSALYLTKPQI